MSDYTKIVDYAAKDALITGNPVKLVKGTELGAEYDAISVAIATKANTASPAFTGVSSFAVGAVGAPSIYMTGYATTGWYNIGANNWGFAVSGAKVLDIASTGLGVTGEVKTTGNLGIGAAPGATAGRSLDIEGLTLTPFVVLRQTGTTANTTTYKQDNANSRVELSSDTFPLHLRIGGTSIGVVSSTGLAVTGTIGATSTLTSTVAAGSAAFTMGAAARFYLDGSVDTFITESSGNNIQFVTGGSAVVNMNTTGLAVTGTTSTTSFFETTEIAAPAAGAANTARIFAVDNGSGKTVLKVQFATGAAQIIATEP